MGKPITTKSQGVCSAFPDVCKTPTPAGPAPIPYPNIGQLSAVQNASPNVKAGGNPVVIKTSTILNSSGDEAGSLGGVKSPGVAGSVSFKTASNTVKANGQGVVRMFDQTEQ